MPVTILFVASNPTAIKFDFSGELTTINQVLSQTAGTIEVMARWSLGVDGLREAIQKMRPDVVHLVSPGVDLITQALVMSDPQGRPEYNQPSVLAAAFADLGKHAPRLVVLNTCDSLAHASALAPHVGCAIGMDGPIYDTIAIAFTRELYLALVGGHSVDAAFRAAQATISGLAAEQRDVPHLVRGCLDPAALKLVSAPTSETGSQRRDAGPTETAAHCAKIFCSYSHKDEKYREELETHLALLARRGAIDVWHDRLIRPGQDWAHEIDHNLEHANLVLLLVSADFLASQYCYGIEMSRALEQAQAGTTRVVPILVRKCDVQGAPFAALQWLPTGSKPVKNWTDRDSAWTDVARGIRKVVEEIGAPSQRSVTR